MSLFSEVRGLRNNNPGNIRHGADWDGLAPDQTDPAFCCFVSPEYGIRAMARIFSNYQLRHGLRTVRELISRWAPPVENDTDAYAAHVAEALGVDPDEPVDVREHLTDLVAVTIRHENGMQPFSAELIEKGVAMAFGPTGKTA